MSEDVITYANLRTPAKEDISVNIYNSIRQDVDAGDFPKILKALKIRFLNELEDKRNKLSDELEMFEQLTRELNNL